jgi:hypothetical protein
VPYRFYPAKIRMLCLLPETAYQKELREISYLSLVLKHQYIKAATVKTALLQIS